MGRQGWFGVVLATIGMAAVAASAVPVILDMGQDWSPIAASAGFGLAFLGLIIGARDKSGHRR